jgi:hypothetical protein
MQGSITGIQDTSLPLRGHAVSAYNPSWEKMISEAGISELRERLEAIRGSAAAYFDEASRLNEGEDIDQGWADTLSMLLSEKGKELRADIKRLSVQIAGAARGAPLIAEADLQDIRHSTRRMLASIHFRRYRYSGVYVHHDEGTVLGVDPPSQREEPVSSVGTAREIFDGSIDDIGELIDLLSPAETADLGVKGTESYRPNTAFIMMAIDKKQPGLEDVKNAIKEVFKEFGITAVTADEIEHEDAITDRILEEIETNEFLIADLTGERPNVYYEVGHAHARVKRVILYRQTGTKVHFDISHRNCPEYQNISDLRQQLRKRMEAVTNKPHKR